MHAMLKPAMRRTWRDRDSVQFGVDPAHAVVLSPVDDASARFLKLLDGTRGPALLRDEATALGLDADRTDRLLATLTRGGVLDDADSLAALAGALRHRDAALERLRPDLASLSLLHPGPGTAAALLAARRTIRVQVRGAGRVGAAVAVVLAASGVGQVDVRDSGMVQPWDTAPAGISSAQVGERRDAAARGAVRRAAPDPRPPVRTNRSGESPGAEPPLALAVLAPRDGLGAYAPDPDAVRELMAAGIPHLYAGVLEGVGTVGPLVVPGVTGCAGCLQAARADADEAWPRVLAQLRSSRPTGPQACDVALATLVSGLAAAHALAFLDAGVPPAPSGIPDGSAVRTRSEHAAAGAGAGTRTEFSLGGLGMRVNSVVPHPGCPCGAVREVPRATMAG